MMIRVKTCTLPVVVCLATWVLVAAPLIVRNVHRFGSPFFNVNSFLLFEDEYHDPDRLAEQASLAAQAREYWQTHTLVDIIERETKGMVWEVFILGRSLGPAPLDDARILFGVPLLFLACIGLRCENGAERGLVVVWSVLLLVMFAWYVPIAAGERFLLPLLIPLLVYAACGLLRVLGLIERPSRVACSRRFVIGALIGWCVVWPLATLLFSGAVQSRFD